MTFGPLVATDWLGEHLGDADLRIIDGSWRMPGQGDAVDNYRAQHIPGAVFFDIDDIADKSTALPHMLPPRQIFEEAAGALGISDRDYVVIYDEQGVFSAARVWWTFRAMGHEKVAVLNGGLPKWLKEGRPVTSEVTIITKTKYSAKPVPSLCASHETVRRALADGTAIVADARPAERFKGAAPEPRAGLRSGGMPGAINIPYDRVLRDTGELRSPEDIREVLKEARVGENAPIITSCGSGVTAALLSLALAVSGRREYAVYDGSWAEWGDEKNDIAVFPVVADRADGQPD